MGARSLPDELVDQILSYDCLDLGDLFETALVCRVWLEPSQKYLYSEVALITVEPYEKIHDNPYPLDRMPSNYTIRTWQLLRTLEDDSDLAALVKSVILRSNFSYPDEGLANTITTPEALVLTVMRLLPFCTSFWLGDLFWFNSARVGSFWPHFDRIQHIRISLGIGEDWWGPFSRLSNLRSLRFSYDIYGIPDYNSSDLSTRLSSRLEELWVNICTVDQFRSLIAGSIKTLKSLKIPLNLLPHADHSLFPNLARLHICHSKETPSADEMTRFLGTLWSSNIATLTLSDDILKLFKDPEMSNKLPSSCTRVNLSSAPTFEGVLSLVQKKRSNGRRIAQLGLPSSFESSKKNQARLVLAGVRALTREAGVDIIWCTEIW